MTNKYLEKLGHVAAAPLSPADVASKYHQFLKDFDLQPEHVWLGHGSALTAHGLREATSDLDAGCNSATMAKLIAKTGRQPHVYGLAEGYLKDNTILLPLPEYDMDMHVEDHITSKDLTSTPSGVNTHGLPMILAQKMALNRPKDQLDIVNIQKRMKELTT